MFWILVLFVALNVPCWLFERRLPKDIPQIEHFKITGAFFGGVWLACFGLLRAVFVAAPTVRIIGLGMLVLGAYMLRHATTEARKFR